MKNKTDGTGYPNKRFAQTYKGLMAANLFGSILFLVISLGTLYDPALTHMGTIDTSRNKIYLISIYFFFPFVMRFSYLNYKYQLKNNLTEDRKYKRILFYIAPSICLIIVTVVFIYRFEEFLGIEWGALCYYEKIFH